MKLHKLAVVIALAAACAPQQKVKSASQASAEARRAKEEKPAEQKPAEAPAAEPSKPTAAAGPAESAKPSEAAKPAETAKPSEAAKAAETAKPREPDKAAETAKPSEAAKAAETAKPSEAAKPAETAKPSEAAKPAETAQPTEAAKPPETAQPPEAARPAEEAKKPEAPPALPLPLPPAEAQKPPAEARPSEPPPLPEPPKAEVAQKAGDAAKSEPPAAEAAPSGPRGGLCVQRPVDAVVPATRELLPAMQAAGPRVTALEPTAHEAVAIQVQFRAGAIDDPRGKAGLTRLAAELMAQGGTESLDAKALRKALFPFAANITARVDKELTTFATRVHKDHVAKVLPIFLDVLLHPRFAEKDFERLRDAAVNDLTRRLRQGDDEALGKAALEELMFAGHPYGHLTEGHVADLKSFTVAELKEHARRVFTAGRATIGVAGGYPEGLGADLARALSALPAGTEPTKAVPAQPPRSFHYRLVEKKGDSTAISLGMPWTLTRDHPDYVALSVARSIFGEHRQMHGRLMQRLREQRGLNYGDYAYIEYFAQEGGSASQAQLGRARHQQEFSLWLRPVQNDNALFALRAALYELHKTLAAEPFSAEEVALTKEFLAGYLLQFDQTDARKLGYALDDQAMGLHRSPGFLDEWKRKLAAVTPAEVNAAWRRWVDPCQLQIVLVTPDAQATKAALLSGAATPIHYQAKAERAPKLLAEDERVARFTLGAPAESEIEVLPVEKLFE